MNVRNATGADDKGRKQGRVVQNRLPEAPPKKTDVPNMLIDFLRTKLFLISQIFWHRKQEIIFDQEVHLSPFMY